MFKNLTIYTIPTHWQMDLAAMEQALSALTFNPCGPTQVQSVGWVPPRGKAGALVESIAGARILKFQIERKSVPSEAVKRRLDERMAQIEQNEGRRPGRKKQRELKEEITQELLPHAFPRTSAVLVWFDPLRRRFAMDSTSSGNLDLIITALVQCLPGLALAPLNTVVAPQAAMTQWLTGDDNSWPAGFAPGRFVELHDSSEMKSVVKFDRHHLDDDQMRLHVGQGKLPVKLALDWNGRVSFVLTQGGQLRKIEFLDGVFDQQADGDQQGGFDADIAISTGELATLIWELTGALGGELE